MADIEKEINTFRDYLVSFLNLIKKWIVTWDVEPKKLLDSLNKVNRKDLIGVAEGTHKIVEISVANSIGISWAQDGTFKLFYESPLIKIPDLELVEQHLKEKMFECCGTISGWDPQFIAKLPVGEYKKIRIYVLSKGADSKKCLAFVKSQKGYSLSAFGGLVIADMVIKNELPQAGPILSFDEKENLPKGSHNKSYIGKLFHAKNSKLEVSHLGDIYRKDTYILIFCD